MMSMELQGLARAQYSFKILVNNVQRSSKKRNAKRNRRKRK